MKTIRVFPRKTKATPDDDLAVVGDPGLFHQADQVLVDCTFTWDIPEAERLAEAWKIIAPIELGGVAFGDPGGEFEPGLFLKQGYTITSRGCPNKCWFCSVWRRDGNIRELQIKDGWNILDDNLLACSESHIRKVFKMLKRQPKRAVFSGGLEAKRLKQWHVDLLRELHPKRIYFANDTDDDYEPLVEAGKMLLKGGFTTASHTLCAYVLIGYPGDKFDQATARLKQMIDTGFTPMAMLYRDEKGNTELDWRKFQRMWARPAIIYARVA